MSRIEDLLVIQRDLSFRLSHRMDVNTIISNCANELINLKLIDNAAMFLYDESNKQFNLQHIKRLPKLLMEKYQQINSDHPLFTALSVNHLKMSSYNPVDKHLFDIPINENGQSVLVPIGSNDQYIGTWILLQQQAKEFEAPELSTIEFVANQMATAIIREIKEAITRRQSQILQTLHDIHQKSEEKYSPESMATEALKIIKAATESTCGCIIKRPNFTVLTKTPCLSNRLPEIPLMDIFINRIKEHPLTEDIWQDSFKQWNILAIALKEGNSFQGILVLSKPLKPFTADQVIIASSVANGLSAAIYRKEQEVNQQAMQAKLLQSAKLSAIGTFTAGIAHEINNPLTAVIGYTQMLVDDKTLTEKQKNHTERIIFNSLRIKNTISKLLASIKPSRNAPLKQVCIHESINEAISMFRDMIDPTQISVEVIPAKKNFIILADPWQLQSLWMNLLSNAKDAVKESKRLDNKIIR